MQVAVLLPANKKRVSDHQEVVERVPDRKLGVEHLVRGYGLSENKTRKWYSNNDDSNNNKHRYQYTNRHRIEEKAINM